MVHSIAPNPYSLPDLPLPLARAPAPSEPPSRGPSVPGRNSPLSGLLGRPPAPPGSEGSGGVRLANRGAAPTPAPAPTQAPTPAPASSAAPAPAPAPSAAPEPAPAPAPSGPQHQADVPPDQELRNKQLETDRQEDQQTKDQIRMNLHTTARTLELKSSERMGMGFKNGADIQSKLI